MFFIYVKAFIILISFNILKMPGADNSIAKVSTIVYDYMLIQLNDAFLERPSINYQIFNSFNQLIRKGSFTGLIMQLRVNHLAEGSYVIHLCINNTESIDYTFKKYPATLAINNIA